MTTDELRKTYLEFFRSKNHKVFSSDSLVPHDDPSLLFTGAGMNQFKPYFLGLKKDVTRATSCQKCLRTADLDRVGKTAYHHSFFEMLGNFSFGDYFKPEAIAFGWEFVTKAVGLKPENLWVSVYEEDDEAFGIWKNQIGLPESRIVRMGPEDNFWPSNAPKDGPNGPCGPCSEIYVGKEAGKGVEIWNLVFTQYDRQSDGSLKPLPQKNIDTGMGLERAAAVIQGVDSNFDADNFVKLRGELKRLLKSGASERAHENAILDHVRAAAFSVSDGATPSNIGRGYVIRKIIRLASEHFQKAGALKPETLHEMVAPVVALYGGVYPELRQREKMIRDTIEAEVGAYLEIARVRGPEFKQLVRKSANDPASLAQLGFKYYDTYGLPFETIQSLAAEAGRTIPAEAFQALLDEQKERSRGSSKIAGEIFKKDEMVEQTRDVAPTRFLGYEKLEAQGKILKVLDGALVFDQTPFYAESGGQVGDTGKIEGASFSAEVLDTQNADKVVIHRVRIERGAPKAGDTAMLRVDAQRRSDIMKNHTATHLMHAALRKALGEHVKQAGSLVAPDYLRFDFTHPKALEPAQTAEIERLVNEQIQKGEKLKKRVMSKDAATAEGAIAFFGEKYGDEVRVVSIGDFSMELCGGTHLESAAEIGRFKITAESSIQAGVRRIEAVTGRGAEAYFQEQEKMIADLSREFSAKPETLPSALKELRSSVEASRSRFLSAAARGTSKRLNGASPVVKRLDGADADLFKSIGDQWRAEGRPFAAMLCAAGGDKASFAVMASADLAAAGFPSGKIVKEVSAIVEGNGGGRPDFAVGGGKRVDKLDEAMRLGEKRLNEELERLKK